MNFLNICYLQVAMEAVEKTTNRGTGAGGKNTNKNGLPYEQLTELTDRYKVLTTDENSSDIQFHDTTQVFTYTKQARLFKTIKINDSVPKAHGCKNPDECYIHKASKTIFIIEKKFQQKSGSICEKIQTSDFKVWQYSRTFPDYKVFYIYCLSDWYKTNCPAELQYNKKKGIPVFWGSNDDYKDSIIAFLIANCANSALEAPQETKEAPPSGIVPKATQSAPKCEKWATCGAKSSISALLELPAVPAPEDGPKPPGAPLRVLPDLSKCAIADDFWDI
ncbi:hypothetical protein KDA11_05700 [Candidatus Saccharibacteria bacterium]|nr:hypothetical protein [Candidatus Saccharibacteria bacterium]